jgi:N-acetyl-gamma-glutamyl-phosphate reductase
MSHKTPVGVYGATGYTGFETLRLLKNHPHAELIFATSQTYAGRTLAEAYPTTLQQSLVSAEEADLSGVEAVFCCLPHAASMPTVLKALSAGVRVIDLSADFRLKSAAVYEQWYRTPHQAPARLTEAVYGLTERNRAEIARTDLLANPGCYPTSVLLALLPLAQAQLIDQTAALIADSKSGVSGAGRKPSLKTHFVEANENLSPYNIGQTHRHTAEMNQTLAEVGLAAPLIFSPHLVPISRGMLSTIYVTLSQPQTAEQLYQHYETAYASEAFVHILPPGELASFAHTQRTNNCVISLTPVNERQVILCSSIDNLGKGAAGQAVQNFNVMFGHPETAGLL